MFDPFPCPMYSLNLKFACELLFPTVFEDDDKIFSFNNKDEKLKFLDGIKEYVDNLEQTYQDA